jgi:hypothetical protein
MSEESWLTLVLALSAAVVGEALWLWWLLLR